MNKVTEYEELLIKLPGILEEEQAPVSIYANVTALIKEHFPHFSWVGFYCFNGKELFLGPFQGKVACVSIALSRGVCGASASQRKTIIVQNVHEFPGHIACDAGSNSEIVVPIIKNQELLGVLDIDSYQLSKFDEVDQKYLEKIVQSILPVLT